MPKKFLAFWLPAQFVLAVLGSGGKAHWLTRQIISNQEVQLISLEMITPYEMWMCWYSSSGSRLDNLHITISVSPSCIANLYHQSAWPGDISHYHSVSFSIKSQRGSTYIVKLKLYWVKENAISPMGCTMYYLNWLLMFFEVTSKAVTWAQQLPTVCHLWTRGRAPQMLPFGLRN